MYPEITEGQNDWFLIWEDSRLVIPSTKRMKVPKITQIKLCFSTFVQLGISSFWHDLCSPAQSHSASCHLRTPCHASVKIFGTSTWSKGFVTSKGRSSSLCGKSGPAHTKLYQVTSPAACKSTFCLWKTFHITNYNQLSLLDFQTVPSKITTSNHPTKPSSLTLLSTYD